MRSRILAVFATLSLSACASVPQDPPLWTRTDGQRITGNAALEQQLTIDQTICKGQTQQSAAVAAPIYAGGIVGGIMQAQRTDALIDVAKGCMAEKGYVLVPTSQALAKQQEFAKTAKQRQGLKGAGG